MKTHRPLRVGSVIREELGKILIKELEFPGAIVSITEVEVGKKMDWATVRVSVLPSIQADAALAALERAIGRLQHLLNRKMSIRPMPRLRFELDRGPENSAIVEKMLMEDRG